MNHISVFINAIFFFSLFCTHYHHRRLSATAFFTTTHHYHDKWKYLKQETRRFHAVDVVDTTNKENQIPSRLIVQNRPLEDITTANIYNLYKFMSSSSKHLHQHHQQQQFIQVEGYVIKHRSYGSSLAFLDVIQSDDKNETAEILFKRDTYIHHQTFASTTTTTNNTSSIYQELELGKSSFTALIHSIKPGMKISMIGIISTTHNPGEVVFLAQNIKILRLPRDPQYIKGILQRIQLDTKNNNNQNEDDDDKRGLDIDEIASCIPIGRNRLRQVLLGKTNHLLFHNISSTTTTFEIMPSTSVNHHNTSMNRNIEIWNRQRIIYASIATEISSILEMDEDYPEIFLRALHSKKSKRGAIQSWDQSNNNSKTIVVQQGQSLSCYRDTMPMAPQGYVQTASKILSCMDTVDNSTGIIMMDETVTTMSSIQQLILDNSSTSPSNHNDFYTITGIIQTTGWVLNRKQYRDSICVLWMTDDLSLDSKDSEWTESSTNRIKCILDRKIMERSYASSRQDSIISDVTSISMSQFDIYSYIASSGTQLDIQGYYVRNSVEVDSTPIIWVTEIRLRRCSWSPQAINFILSLLSRPLFNKRNVDHDTEYDDDDNTVYPLSLEEIKSAFDLPGGETEAKQLIQFCRDNDATARQWRAAEISKKLQEINTRSKILSSDMLELLDRFESIRKAWPVENVKRTDIKGHTSSSFNKRGSAGSRWERVKRPQLEWITEEIVQLVQNHPEFGTRPLNIIDIGGGRGHLANQVSTVLGTSAIVHVIDIDSRVVKNGMMHSKRNMLQVQYAVGDASDLSFLTEQWGSQQSTVDVVVALHACGTLSDVALAFASSHSASFVIVPCCFRSNNHLLVNIKPKDSQVQSLLQEEWLGVSSENLKFLKLMAETQGDTLHASKGIHTICSLRANAVKRFQENFNIRLKIFPVSFSTRNFYIVGSPQKDCDSYFKSA